MPNFAPMNKKRLLLPLMLLGVVSASAQRRLVVADLETELPVAQVSVQGKSRVAYTDSLGCFEVPDSSLTLLFSHVNYEPRLVNIDEVGGDTIYLVSKLLNLKEVVVFGKGMIEDERLKELNKRLRMARTEAQLAAADPSKPANFLPLLSKLISKLLPKKWKKSTHREQLKRALDEY